MTHEMNRLRKLFQKGFDDCDLMPYQWHLASERRCTPVSDMVRSNQTVLVSHLRKKRTPLSS